MDEPAQSLVVVGASAGGVEALTALAAGLPDDLSAAVCVVLHLPAGAESRLADIISRAGPLPAVQARGGERLERGRIYVTPPDRHLTVRGSRVLVARGPHENGVRPSIDVLFRSAAVAYGPRAVAVTPPAPGTTASRARVRSAPAAAASSSRTRRTRASQRCRRTRWCATTRTGSCRSPSLLRRSPRWSIAFRRRSK